MQKLLKSFSTLFEIISGIVSIISFFVKSNENRNFLCVKNMVGVKLPQNYYLFRLLFGIGKGSIMKKIQANKKNEPYLLPHVNTSFFIAHRVYSYKTFLIFLGGGGEHPIKMFRNIW